MSPWSDTAKWMVLKKGGKFANSSMSISLEWLFKLEYNFEQSDSSTDKQINIPLWGTKSQSISLDFQKQVSHQHKRLSVPAASKTQTQNARKQLSAGPSEAQLNVIRKRNANARQYKHSKNQEQILYNSPGITSQMGTSRVCSKLAKLHSSFPSNTPSQSPIGLSWKSWRHDNLVTLLDAPQHWNTD